MSCSEDDGIQNKDVGCSKKTSGCVLDATVVFL